MEENELLKQVREEYEKKIQELEEKHKQEMEDLKKSEEEKRIKDIKALISGKKNPDTEKVEEEGEELSFYDENIKLVRERLNLHKEEK